MTLIPEIDTFACVAHGDCAVVAPQAFRVDDVAAVFALFGLIYLLHAGAWGIWELFDIGDGPWFGFLIVTLVLFLLGAIGGLLAFRMIKKAMPPTPAMALEEAQLIRETVSGSQPEHPGTAVPEVRR